MSKHTGGLVDDEAEQLIVPHLKRLVPEYQPMGAWREVMEHEASRTAVARGD
jgi:hypothetical protein